MDTISYYIIPNHFKNSLINHQMKISADTDRMIKESVDVSKI